MREDPLISDFPINGNADPGEDLEVEDRSSLDDGRSIGEPLDLVGIETRLGAMGSQLEMFHARSEQYESIIRRMQSKIEDLQSDQVRTLLKPVINRLAVLYTEAVSAAQRAADRGDLKSQKDFGYFADEVEEGLGMLDIESLDTKVDDEFDAARHAARGATVTGDQSLDRKVAGVVRQGFTYVGAERVFLPALVKVYRFDPDAVVPHDVQATIDETFAESEGEN